MKIKETLKATYQVLTIVVTVIEAVDLGKSIYSKVKNRKAAAVTTQEITPEPAAEKTEGDAQ